VVASQFNVCRHDGRSKILVRAADPLSSRALFDLNLSSFLSTNTMGAVDDAVKSSSLPYVDKDGITAFEKGMDIVLGVSFCNCRLLSIAL
jgi:hypothetical protein